MDFGQIVFIMKIIGFSVGYKDVTEFSRSLVHGSFGVATVEHPMIIGVVIAIIIIG